ncbi:hypothetical protein TH606_08660 [Thermodesulfatator autotrophicus]|uniref:LPS export ABC transporter periplasmic protein LptC n=1 Tax=Thermodesulfatator autotrophicus TaxID=1795632 RepID=A0A177E5Q3_9BACT|nr:hypothetical protein TH606_08660 [Thermodesulfatator autotrophicus]
MFLIFLVGCSCSQQSPKTLDNARIPEHEEKTSLKIKETKSVEEKLVPTLEIKKLYYVIYEQGKLKWKIWAEKALMYEKDRINFLSLKICARPEEGFCITAEKGDYDSLKDEFIFKNNVHLKTKNKGELFTSYLKYLAGQNLLITTAEVKIIKEGLVIRGKGLVYDLKAGKMKILKQTEVKIDA